MIRHLVEIFECTDLIRGSTGFMAPGTTHDLSFSRFIRAMLLGLLCVAGTLFFGVPGGSIRGARKSHRRETAPW